MFVKQTSQNGNDSPETGEGHTSLNKSCPADSSPDEPAKENLNKQVGKTGDDLNTSERRLAALSLQDRTNKVEAVVPKLNTEKQQDARHRSNVESQSSKHKHGDTSKSDVPKQAEPTNLFQELSMSAQRLPHKHALAKASYDNANISVNDSFAYRGAKANVDIDDSYSEDSDDSREPEITDDSPTSSNIRQPVPLQKKKLNYESDSSDSSCSEEDSQTKKLLAAPKPKVLPQAAPKPKVLPRAPAKKLTSSSDSESSDEEEEARRRKHNIYPDTDSYSSSDSDCQIVDQVSNQLY